ncbi:hypothetical protein FACS1894139_12740 [Planctomycetales bacterium]|nr:hypothetical protein FACS1894108_07650 [Planctomycetales bacterium]GHT06574.1 hypothetical protein FACS1894139_12740 [Planctomycetales bacterium]
MRSLFCLLLFCAVVAAAAAEDGLVARVTPAVVFIAGGSGALISASGEIVTNHHVIENLNKTVGVTLGDGRVFDADIVGRDRQGDLALLKINGAKPLPFLPLGSSAALSVGEFCLAAGNPLALGATDQTVSFSAGVVSALHQFRQGYNDAIVTDAAVNPGNSGGPLINRRGELIGICGMTQTRLGLKSNAGVAYAIPADQIKLWLPFLRSARGGNVFHGRLTGVDWREDNGVVSVAANRSDLPLMSGDILRDFMGHRVPTLARLASIEGIYPAGITLALTAERDGKAVKIDFQLPPLRPARPLFVFAKPQTGDVYPRLQTVFADTSAARAGVRGGDEITAINDLPVRVGGLPQLTNYLGAICAGDEVTLTLSRAGERRVVKFVAE